MIQTRIINKKVNHLGKELETYVPQINIGYGWRDVLGENSYILKESHNPLVICEKCNGSGCKPCNGVGLRKGIPKDNKDIAGFFIEKAVKDYNRHPRPLVKEARVNPPDVEHIEGLFAETERVLLRLVPCGECPDAEHLHSILEWFRDRCAGYDRVHSVTGSLGVATTIGNLKKMIENYPDDTSFGFRNQPIQELHEVKYDNVVSVVFQPPKNHP